MGTIAFLMTATAAIVVAAVASKAVKRSRRAADIDRVGRRRLSAALADRDGDSISNNLSTFVTLTAIVEADDCSAARYRASLPVGEPSSDETRASISPSAPADGTNSEHVGVGSQAHEGGSSPSSTSAQDAGSSSPSDSGGSSPYDNGGSSSYDSGGSSSYDSGSSSSYDSNGSSY